MSFRNRDLRRGSNSYLTVYEWDEIPEPFGTGQQTTVEYILESQANAITSIFEHIYYPYEYLDSTGEKHLSYLDCGLTNNEIYQDFLSIYGELPLLKPYYHNNIDGTKDSVGKMVQIMQAVMNQNLFKYKKLAATLGFEYNPINNYDMEESGTDTTTPSGTETVSHNVNANKLGGIKITGPAENVEIGEDSETGLPTIDFEFTENGTIGYKETNASDVEQGQKTGGTADAPSLVAGTAVQTKQYTTTNDDKSTGRLLGYEDTLGTTGQLSKVKAEQDNPLMAEVTAGAPNHPSYTDTKTFTNRQEEKEHTFARHGNIGVMSTQDLINQEREVVRYSLEREFLDDIRKALCLQVWDW